MKFFSAIVTGLGLAASATAVATPTRPADILKARQFNPRQLIDVCANVDADLKVDLLGIAVVVGVIDVCLCVSALPVFIETNLVAAAAVDLVGLSAVEAALEALINAAGDHKSCSYPAHATPVCSAGNPCGFTCPSGFTPSPPPPATPTACVGSGPSAAPATPPKKRST